MWFDEKPKWGEASLIDENGNELKRVRTFSFNVNAQERITLINPVLSPVPNTVDVSIEGDTVHASFKANILSHEGLVRTFTLDVKPTVTCQRQSRPHALNGHGDVTCDTPIPYEKTEKAP